MNSTMINNESTIYHYKLLRKIQYNNIILIGYIGSLLLYLLGATVVSGIHQWISFILGYVIVFGMHLLITWAFLSVRDEFDKDRWALRLKLPLMGLLPNQFTAFTPFSKLQGHLFWMPLAVIGCISPWASLNFVCTLTFLHVWLSLPRLFVIYAFNKEAKPGIIKINEQDVSYYLP